MLVNEVEARERHEMDGAPGGGWGSWLPIGCNKTGAGHYSAKSWPSCISPSIFLDPHTTRPLQLAPPITQLAPAISSPVIV